MKYIIFILYILFGFNSCQSQENSSDSASEKVEPQYYETEDGDSILIGKVNQAALMDYSNAAWLNASKEYEPNLEVIEQLKEPLQDYRMEVFFGTWCGDSKRHVPELLAIAKAANYNLQRIELIAVGNEGSLYKKSPDGEEEGKNITHVPTILFYQDGEEVNRIVENPVNASLEQDILEIVTGKDYEHKYENF